MSYRRTFKIFGETEFDQFAGLRLAELKHLIWSAPPDQILNVNQEEHYFVRLASQFQIAPLVLRFDTVEASRREEMIPAERFPQFMFAVDRGQSYSRPVFTYHLPVSGDLSLLECIPNPHLVVTHPVYLEGGEVCFDIVDFAGGNAQYVRTTAGSIIEDIKKQTENLAPNVGNFNTSLRQRAETEFNSRKQELARQMSTLAELGVPIRKSS